MNGGSKTGTLCLCEGVEKTQKNEYIEALPHISSREHAIVVHLTIGIAFCCFFFGQKKLLAFIMISTVYFIIDKDHYLVFKISFIMNSIIHCIQFCWSSHYKVSNLTIIVFYKIVATSFNLDDCVFEYHILKKVRICGGILKFEIDELENA